MQFTTATSVQDISQLRLCTGCFHIPCPALLGNGPLEGCVDGLSVSLLRLREGPKRATSHVTFFCRSLLPSQALQ